MRALVDEPADLVLLDIDMPGLSGADALPAIRVLAPLVKAPANPPTPAAIEQQAETAQPEQQDARRLAEAPAQPSGLQPLLSVEEVAPLLGMDPSTLRKRARPSQRER